MHTTHDFDSIMTANPAMAQSFKSQFIPPQMIYTLQCTTARVEAEFININWQFTCRRGECTGAALSCVRAARQIEELFFGTPFSQFVKQTQLVWGRRAFRRRPLLEPRGVLSAALCTAVRRRCPTRAGL